MKKLLVLFAFLSMAFVPPTSEYRLSSKSHFEIAGTSTLHDWTMTTQQAKGGAQIVIKDGRIVKIDRLKISLPAESMKSGKGPMDQNAYKALKTDAHPTITFDLVGIEKLENINGATRIRSTGKLTIAGKTCTEDIVVISTTASDGTITCKGSKKLKMSSYNVEPPSFMFNTVKTGDDITVSFNIEFNKQ